MHTQVGTVCAGVVVQSRVPGVAVREPTTRQTLQPQRQPTTAATTTGPLSKPDTKLACDGGFELYERVGRVDVRKRLAALAALSTTGGDSSSAPDWAVPAAPPTQRQRVQHMSVLQRVMAAWAAAELQERDQVCCVLCGLCVYL
jgi:hypothetical protein